MEKDCKMIQNSEYVPETLLKTQVQTPPMAICLFLPAIPLDTGNVFECFKKLQHFSFPMQSK